jgi:hypothetical protein
MQFGKKLEKCEGVGLHIALHYQWQWNEKKEEIDFVKIKFHLNENIEWICNSNQILKLSSNTLNLIEIQFNEIWI